MSIGRRLAERWSAAFGPRVSGFPTSSNKASSFHLRWVGLPAGDPLVEVSATLEIVQPPVVPRLYFWALQASFVEGTRQCGAGHLGLQWHSAHPGGTAINWGGYDSSARELDGSRSEWPSATGNQNTRDFSWEPGRPYRLSISTGSRLGDWRGSVDGDVVRELHGGGTSLADVMVWSEVFARCDDPTVVVRWSDFSARTTGATVAPDRLVVSYQSKLDGGCDNTSVLVARGAADQLTNVAREVPPGAVLFL
jgi:hypothetical protein